MNIEKLVATKHKEVHKTRFKQLSNFVKILIVECMNILVEIQIKLKISGKPLVTASGLS